MQRRIDSSPSISSSAPTAGWPLRCPGTEGERLPFVVIDAKPELQADIDRDDVCY